MNKYHSNIILTVEVNPSKFLDTKVSRSSNEIKCFKYHKEMKLPFHWTSAVPKHHKKNVLLEAYKSLSLNFEQELRMIKNKNIKAG